MIIEIVREFTAAVTPCHEIKIFALQRIQCCVNRSAAGQGNRRRRQTGPQTWDIDIETDAGPVALRHGGNELWVGGVKAEGAADIMGEYPALYARMAALVHGGESDVDLAPMVHVADALTIGKRVTVAAFDF